MDNFLSRMTYLTHSLKVVGLFFSQWKAKHKIRDVAYYKASEKFLAKHQLEMIIFSN